MGENFVKCEVVIKPQTKQEKGGNEMFCFRKHHIKITMRKRIYKRLTAGLLCVVLLFADTTSMMKLRASSIDSDAGQIAALEASGEESATNEEAVIEGVQRKKPQKRTQKKKQKSYLRKNRRRR